MDTGLVTQGLSIVKKQRAALQRLIHAALTALKSFYPKSLALTAAETVLCLASPEGV